MKKTHAKWFITAAFAAFLVGCAGAPPQKFTNAQKNQLALRWRDCLVQNVSQLDDGKSDAHTVATALAALCHPDYFAWAASNASGIDGMIPQEMFMRKAMNIEVDDVTILVLKYRKSK